MEAAMASQSRDRTVTNPINITASVSSIMEGASALSDDIVTLDDKFEPKLPFLLVRNEKEARLVKQIAKIQEQMSQGIKEFEKVSEMADFQQRGLDKYFFKDEDRDAIYKSESIFIFV